MLKECKRCNCPERGEEFRLVLAPAKNSPRLRTKRQIQSTFVNSTMTQRRHSFFDNFENFFIYIEFPLLVRNFAIFNTGTVKNTIWFIAILTNITNHQI